MPEACGENGRLKHWKGLGPIRIQGKGRKGGLRAKGPGWGSHLAGNSHIAIESLA